jgi:sirohydrochlorin ferrochelatase
MLRVRAGAGRPHAVSPNLVRAALILRRPAQASEAMACEVSLNLARHAGIDTIQ